MAGNVLLIDDEEKLRGLLKRILSLEGYTVIEAGTLAAGRKLLDKENIDVIVCDVKLPDGNGVDAVTTFKKDYPEKEIILLTAYGNIADGVQAIKSGAFDYITKGDDNERIIPLVSRAFEKVQMQQRIRHLEKQVGKQYTFDAIIGTSAVIRDAVNLAGKVAPLDTTVLLLGETGTGKEVFAQAIHQASPRNRQSFVAVNCSAFPRELLESEIFGHKAGAYTGALKDKKGLMEEAHKGSFFLDEIGEMPLELQSKLLRVLETGEFIKVGDTKPVKVDVRIIAATNRGLQQEVNEGKFREDLFFRLNVFTINLPSLNERKEDIPLLAKNFLGVYSTKINKRLKGLTPDFITCLQQHNWQGNIRELKNVIERAVIMENSDELTVNSLPADFLTNTAPSKPGVLSAFDMASVEKLHIQRVLNHTKGNKTEAARLLNIGLTTLYRKIEEYKIL
ncbi:MAG: sigma-54 dependent transcriptional regulator [Chitinophagaceae bacterium]